MDVDLKFFEHELYLSLRLLTLLLRIVDFSQNLEKTCDPRIGAVEDLNLALGRLAENIADKDDHILVAVQEPFNKELLEVDLSAEDRSVAGQGQDADESAQLLEELFDYVRLAARLLDDLEEVFLRDQHATLHNVNRDSDCLAHDVLGRELLEQLDVDV